MNDARCVLRFRTAGDGGPALPASGRLIVDLLVNDQTAPVGHIAWLEPSPGIPGRWIYLTADGQATGLQSVLSRQDLEGMVAEHHFQALTADRQRSA